MYWSLQNVLSATIFGCGLCIALIFSNSYLVLLGYMFVGGGGILFLMNFERRWVKRNYLKKGLLATIVLAIVYGILEYIFFDSTWNNWFKISDWFPNKYYYWGFMTILNFTLVFLISHKSIGLSLASIPLFAVNEDLWYWITKSIHELRWVFPVGNWFDQRFPFLQGLGDPIYSFPYWPRFYFVGWILVSILLIIQFKNLQGGNFLIGVGGFVYASCLCLLLIPV